MAKYCPECNREFSEDKESCPMCGFKIKEFNQQAEKQQKKDANAGLLKKIMLGIITVILIVVAINIISANQELQSFKTEVDEFTANWDKMIRATQENPPDLLEEDLSNKALVSGMQDISEMYVQFDDKTKVNEYLEEHTWKEQYERVMRYNEEHEKREIEQEFIEFYTHMGE